MSTEETIGAESSPMSSCMLNLPEEYFRITIIFKDLKKIYNQRTDSESDSEKPKNSFK